VRIPVAPTPAVAPVLDPVEPRATRTWSLVRDDPGLVVAVALAIAASAAAVVYFHGAGLTLAYDDAQSRLLIARTVLDGRHPGLAQLGGIWPPLPQLAMLPFAWNDALFYSGIAGAIPSAVGFVAAAGFLYKLVARLTLDPLAGIVAVVAFSGPNVLYFQSLPMSELPFTACFLGTVYFAVSWMLRGSLYSLFMAALMACLGTLCRYEGWVLVVLLTVAVIWFCTRAGHRYEEIEGIVVLFGLMAFLGVGLWFLWNGLIFGDALYFLHSQYGTKAINGLEMAAMPPASRPSGNLALSVEVVAWDVLDNLGVVAVGLAALGLGRLALARRFGPATVTASVLLLFPLAFNLAAAYSGAEVIADPSATPGVGPTNVRYGLLMAPAAGFLVGWLAHGWRLRWPVAVASLLSAALVWHAGLVEVQEARSLVARPQTRVSTSAGEWIRQHYDGGLVLMQRRTNERLLFTSRVPLGDIVYEGDRNEWASDLSSPEAGLRWLVMDAGDPTVGAPADQVWLDLHDRAVDDGYERVYQDGPIEVYRR
jgi:Dolichyl-phosphate-mannose-protein mannosyltransferase